MRPRAVSAAVEHERVAGPEDDAPAVAFCRGVGVEYGVGMRYNITNRLALRFDYGCALTDTPGQPLSKQEIHLGVVTLFGPQP